MLANILLQIQQAGTEVATEAAETTAKLNIFSLAVKGGWIMIVLAIVSIVAIYIFVERFLALKKALKEDKNFMDNVKDCIHKGDLEGAKRLTNNNDTPIGRMIAKGLSRLGRPLNDINQAIENVGKLEVARLENGVSMVGTIAALGPSLGFLGTVTGMVKAFFDMSTAGNNIDIQLLSSGIYEAMVTTVGGLIVGIIANFLYSILVGQINKIVFMLEARTMEFMDLLHEPAQ
ncbi:MAG: MotA/TolQ/ExbB proton channel family protein [Bacteroidales bacterium]|jgi:biopolymer transport protein ExbB|nr:MotA/TolQ/ExbB proton channel family protein [Bacteroidales bacterium]MEE0895104.1 MotA/TolQ/ExbB proton channel family protein [Bacteroidales bacterium]MEE0917004.1 MotA/TolQ/ExbB proton channel family protein [Bacteroidales bacterium]MEE0947515.1 MotA/TolQ/ExbB proton channel family protein [Bacteroidales bacterium]MEE0992981.1 MotA/TolQ/ExbB proton channel family protein [Bacteroidales bacterium]